MKKQIFIIAALFALSSISKATSNSILDKPINIKTNVSLAIEKKNPLQIYYFWASWCSDCKEKLKTDLSKYQNNLIDFSTFSIEKDKDKIVTFTEKNEVKSPVYFDSERELQKLLKVYSVPTVVLAKWNDKNIEVIKSVTGKDWSTLDIEIEKLKKEYLK